VITANVESFTVCFDEWRGLIAGHWERLALDRDKVPLDPMWDSYFTREERGELMFLVLRDRGRMIGYWLAFIAPGLHYKTCLTATMDIWYLVPGYEQTMASMILMRGVEHEYKRRGVDRSFVGEKLHRPCGRLYEAFGYQPIETYYSKWIGAE